MGPVAQKRPDLPMSRAYRGLEAWLVRGRETHRQYRRHSIRLSRSSKESEGWSMSPAGDSTDTVSAPVS